MFSTSTFVSLTLIVVTAAPGLCAPVPAAQDASISSRSLASIIKGFFPEGPEGEQIVEGLIGNLLGGGSSINATASVPVAERALSGSVATKVIGGAAGLVGSLVGGEIPDILEKLFNRRAFTDLSDDEVNTLLEYINNNVDKRELNARVALPKGALTDVLKKLAGSALSSAARDGLEKLLGLDSDADADATAEAPAATDAPAARRALTFADPTLTQIINGQLPDHIEELNKVLEYINSVDKRELNARLALPKGAISGIIKKLAGGALTSGAFAGLEKLLGGDSDANATAVDSATTDAPVSRRALAGRSLASTIEGVLGRLFPGEQVVEGLVGNLLGGGSGSSELHASDGTTPLAARSIARTVSASTATKVIGGAAGLVGSLVGGEIPDILEKLFSRRAFTDLSDDEVNTLLEYINNNVDKRNLNARVTLPKGVLSGVIKKLAGGALTSGAFAGLEKLLGGDSDSAADPATTDAPVSRRAFTDLSDDEVNGLFEWIDKITSAPAGSGSLNELD